MKRFTETAKWSKEWFQELSPKHKCLWLFLCDHVDAAGVWDTNYKEATFRVGVTIKAEDFKELGGRARLLLSGKWLLVSFIDFQYGTLSRDCKAHIPVFKTIEKHRLSIAYAKGIHTLQETETETEEDRRRRLQEEEDERQPREAAAKKNAHDVLPTTPEAKTIAAMFNRKESTAWSAKEIEAYRGLVRAGLLTPENLELLGRYYAAERAKGDDGFHRRDLATFLNNFTGELDRATQSRAGKAVRTAAAQNGHSEPPGFREWFSRLYSERAGCSYEKIPQDIKDEFHRERK